MTGPRAWLAALLAVVAIGIAGCWWVGSADSRTADAAHDAALARWEANEPASYSFQYSYCSGFCAECRLHVTVTDGHVTDAVARGQGCSPTDVEHAPTIEDVFAMEARDRDDDHWGSVDIGYDARYGFPEWVNTLCAEAAADCGIGYEVTDFEPID